MEYLIASLIVALSRANGGKLQFDEIVRYNEMPGLDSEQSDTRDDINTVLRAIKR